MALFYGFATIPDWARGSYVSRDEDDGPYTDRAQQSSAAFSRLSAVDEEELIAACTGAQPPTKTRLPRGAGQGRSGWLRLRGGLHPSSGQV
jgi:hypothetical protein